MFFSGATVFSFRREKKENAAAPEPRPTERKCRANFRRNLCRDGRCPCAKPTGSRCTQHGHVWPKKEIPPSTDASDHRRRAPELDRWLVLRLDRSRQRRLTPLAPSAHDNPV